MNRKHVLFILNLIYSLQLSCLDAHGQEIVYMNQNPSEYDWYRPEPESIEPQEPLSFARPEHSLEEFDEPLPNNGNEGDPSRSVKFQFGGHDDDDDHYGVGWGYSDYHYSSYPSYGWGGGGHGWKPYSKIDLLHEALDVGHSAIQLIHKKKYLKKGSHKITFSKGWGSGSGWGWGGSSGWGWGW